MQICVNNSFEPGKPSTRPPLSPKTVEVTNDYCDFDIKSFMNLADLVIRYQAAEDKKIKRKKATDNE